MSCTISHLQTMLVDIIEDSKSIMYESGCINKAYWSTDANTVVGALANGTDACTYATGLTKTEFISGITLMEDLYDFFTNGTVTQTDYVTSCNKLKYGTAVTPVKLSNSIESIGDRMKAVAEQLLDMNAEFLEILDIYFDNQVNLMVANLDAQRVLTCNEGMTVDEFGSAITLVENLQKFLNNMTPSQADYASTISKWERFISH